MAACCGAYLKAEWLVHEGTKTLWHSCLLSGFWGGVWKVFGVDFERVFGMDFEGVFGMDFEGVFGMDFEGVFGMDFERVFGMDFEGFF